MHYLNLDLPDLHHPKLLNLELGNLYKDLCNLPLDCNLAVSLDFLDLDSVSHVEQTQPKQLAKLGS